MSVHRAKLLGMANNEYKAVLHRYLSWAQEILLWKLDGLSDYDVRRPLTPTGTNLLGLLKHNATTVYGYFGDTFARPYEDGLPWMANDGEDIADMWATADESRDFIVGLYRRAWSHADATIETLALDAPGRVPWWPDDRADVNLQQIMVHMLAETQRHAGHADIVRESIDGEVGLLAGKSNLPDVDAAWWPEYRERLEEVAREFRGD